MCKGVKIKITSQNNNLGFITASDIQLFSEKLYFFQYFIK
jgi:hypothetical protein